MLALDALYAGDIVAACRAVGAQGALGYVWRPGGIGDWSLAKFDALRSAELGLSPIFVPPASSPPSWSTIKAAAEAMGFGPGPIVGDLEGPYNLPPASWWSGFCLDAGADGWRPYLYGNQGDVGSYPKGEGWWQARYVQHSVQPVPQLPSGLAGWQYADQVTIDGLTYDASVVSPQLLGGHMALDPNDPTVKAIQDDLGLIKNLLIFAPDVTVAGSTVHPRTALIADVFNLVSKIEDQVASGGGGAAPAPGSGISLSQLADALDAASAKLRAGG